MSQHGSYDLLLPRKPGWKAEAVLIISPYVEADFFRIMARRLRPKSLHVVIDDGCRREDRQMVADALHAGRYRRKPWIKFGSARGLVHLKLFYMRWRTPAGSRAHSLVFGSANATRQGFAGDHNAELLAGCSLTSKHHARLIAWCDRVIAATMSATPVDVPSEVEASPAKGMQLRLPALTVGRKPAAVSDFDLWIQRGSLLSEYRPDPAFLQVVVQLARPLSAGEHSRAAEKAGFEMKPTRSIRHRYIDDGSAAEDPEIHGTADRTIAGTWRRKLFTWTNLGEWCSLECVGARQSEFLRKNHDKRRAALAHLQGMAVKEARKAARELFISKMDALWAELGEDASNVLHGTKTLDRKHYRDIFDVKVKRDLALVHDEEFGRRYVSGFELVGVPRFRNDVTGWRAFVRSLAQQLALDGARGSTRSRLLRAIRDAADTAGVDEAMLLEPGSLLDFLRQTFRVDDGRREAASILTRYHLA